MASQLVPAYEKASGRKVMVPEFWIGHARFGAGLTTEKPSDVEAPIDRTSPDAAGASKPHTPEETGAAVVVEDEVVAIPEGEPTSEWTNKQLDALAERDGVDLTGATNKAERLARLTNPNPQE